MTQKVFHERSSVLCPWGPEPHHSLLSMASPKPGVSMMLSLSLIPFSSMPTVCLTMSTVWWILSVDTSTCKVCHPNDSNVRKKTLLAQERYQVPFWHRPTNEDWSHLVHSELSCLCRGLWETNCWWVLIYRGQIPLETKWKRLNNLWVQTPVSTVRMGGGIQLKPCGWILTCHHECECETFFHCLSMNLVGQCGKSHILLVLILPEWSTNMNSHRLVWCQLGTVQLGWCPFPQGPTRF